MTDTATAPAPTAPPSLVNTPLSPAPKTPEATLFPTTPGSAPSATPPKSEAPAEPPAAPPVTPPAAPTEPPKTPTEPTKPEVKSEPASTTPPTASTDYVLALPEGSLLSAEDLATLQKEAKEAGLTKEEAEEVVKSHNQVAANTAARLKAQQEKVMVDAKVLWKSEIEKDPELGGEHLAETALLSSRGYAALVTPEDKKWIEQLGLDHTPTFVRMMAKVGRLIGEDNRLILGRLGGAPGSKSPEKVLYGKTTPDGSGQEAGLRGDDLTGR